MAGRGRGNWKQKPNTGSDIKINTEILSEMTNLQGPRSSSVNFEDANETSTASKYDNIIVKISMLRPDDDGILVNQKYRHILETWQSLCDSTQAVGEALDVIHRRGLYDAEFATKLVNMLSSVSFNSLEIHNVKIRNQFIAKLQQDFDNCKTMQVKCPIAFRNAARMLGEFYHKARLTSGKPIQFFASPLRTYLEMLLDSAQEEDLELFAIQLYMNGLGIQLTLAEQLNETLLKVRSILANSSTLTSTSKAWLLFALDAAYHNFGILPDDLQRFYIKQLGDKVVMQFERVNTELTIQTIHRNDVIEKVTNSVNALKVENNLSNNWDGSMSKMGGGDSFAPPPEQQSPAVKVDSFCKPVFENHDGPKPSFGREKYLVKAQTYKKITPDSGVVNNWDSPNGKRENAMRPILGVGARLQQHKSNEIKKSDESNWRDRSDGDWREPKSDLNPAAAGWESKRPTGGSSWSSDSNKESSGKKSSWSQHDDRTETDYSNT